MKKFKEQLDKMLKYKNSPSANIYILLDEEDSYNVGFNAYDNGKWFDSLHIQEFQDSKEAVRLATKLKKQFGYDIVEEAV